MKRNRLALTIIFVIFLSLIMVSCSSSNSKIGSFDQVEIPENERYSAPGQFPFVKKEDNVTLTIAVDHPTLVKDFVNNDFTKYIEERANIKINWIIWDSTEARKKFINSMEDGSYPDIFLGMSILYNDIEKYGVSQKKFIALDELIDKHTLRLKSILNAKPDIVKMISASDGKIYSVPSLEEYYPGVYGSKIWINSKWLEKLNLDMPKTTEEFYQTLLAFKNNDPNGNNAMDEIPFIFAKASRSSPNFLLNAFLFTNYEFSYYNLLCLDDSGRVTVTVAKPEFREGLKYLNKLYNEGLIYPDAFNITASEVKNIFRISSNSIGAFAAENPMIFIDSYENLNDYVMLQPLQGPSGHVSTAVYPDYPTIGSFVITDHCKEPVVAIKLADYLLTNEGTLNNKYGIKGKGWYDANESARDLYGGNALWVKNDSIDNDVGSIRWLRGPYWLDTELLVKKAYSSDNNKIRNLDDLNRMLYIETEKNYEPYGSKYIKNVLPPIWFNTEESEQVQKIWEILTNYVKEQCIGFIVGSPDLIDKEWENYLGTLDELGLNDYVAIYQAAYDRRYK